MANLHYYGGNGVGVERVPHTRTTRAECPALPKGWVREEVPRRTDNTHGNSGSSINSHIKGASNAPRSDVYYISPMGKRVRSKPELMKFFGDTVDLTNFEYRSGKINPMLSSRRGEQSSGKSASNHHSGSKTHNGRISGTLSSSGGHGGVGGRGSDSGSAYDLARGLRADASLVPPIRQTASIFKQPVTVRIFSSYHYCCKME